MSRCARGPRASPPRSIRAGAQAVEAGAALVEEPARAQAHRHHGTEAGATGDQNITRIWYFTASTGAVPASIWPVIMPGRLTMPAAAMAALMIGHADAIASRRCRRWSRSVLAEGEPGLEHRAPRARLLGQAVQPEGDAVHGVAEHHAEQQDHVLGHTYHGVLPITTSSASTLTVKEDTNIDSAQANPTTRQTALLPRHHLCARRRSSPRPSPPPTGSARCRTAASAPDRSAATGSWCAAATSPDAARCPRPRRSDSPASARISSAASAKGRGTRAPSPCRALGVGGPVRAQPFLCPRPPSRLLFLHQLAVRAGNRPRHPIRSGAGRG